jgi:hypothetical protein
MNVQEMMKIAAQAAPEVVEKTAFELKLLERVAPEFVPDVQEGFRKITETVTERSKTAAVNPGVLDTSSRVARLGSWGKRLGADSASSVASGVLGGLGMAVAADLYNVVRKNLRSGTHWKNMLAANPELREKDLDVVRQHYKSLRDVAPALAANPMAAGAAVSQLLDTAPMSYHRILTEMAESQKKMVDAQYRLSGGGPKK